MTILISPLLQGALLLVAGLIATSGDELSPTWIAGVSCAMLAVFGVIAPLSSLFSPRPGDHLSRATVVWLWLAFLLTIAGLVDVGYQRMGDLFSQQWGTVAGALVFPFGALIVVVLRPLIRPLLTRIAAPAPVAPAPDPVAPAPDPVAAPPAEAAPRDPAPDS